MRLTSRRLAHKTRRGRETHMKPRKESHTTLQQTIQHMHSMAALSHRNTPRPSPACPCFTPWTHSSSAQPNREENTSTHHHHSPSFTTSQVSEAASRQQASNTTTPHHNTTLQRWLALPSQHTPLSSVLYPLSSRSILTVQVCPGRALTSQAALPCSLILRVRPRM